MSGNYSTREFREKLFVYLSLMEIMSYLHFDYWKKTARSGASMNKENK